MRSKVEILSEIERLNTVCLNTKDNETKLIYTNQVLALMWVIKTEHTFAKLL